jgi:Uncharacterized protein conserved in bacteria (DUF2188)
MASNRYVKPAPNGGWDILKEGHRRALLRYDTQRKAVARARELTRREGGGEVRILNSVGKIVRETTVTAAAARRAA